MYSGKAFSLIFNSIPMGYAYILKNLKTNRHYYGSTEDLNKRLAYHNSGKVRSTKAFRPWEIHYFETFQTKGEAARRELFFKSIDGYNFLKSEKII